MSRSWTLTIPVPEQWLSLNHRSDRRSQTPARRDWRWAGYVYARQAKLPHLNRAHITATLRFIDQRRRDSHNYMPTLKALVDGLVDAKVIPDDDWQHLIGPDVRMGEPRKPAAVELLIEELANP